MTPELAIIYASLIIGLTSSCVTPRFSRTGIFFGVTVHPEFHSTSDAAQILSRYRWTILSATVIGAVFVYAVSPLLHGLEWLIGAGAAILLQYCGWTMALRRANLRAQGFALPSSIRTASLSPRQGTLPFGWLVFAGPMVLVIATGVLLFQRRETLLPEEFRGALSLLVAPLVADILFLSLACFSAFQTRLVQRRGNHRSLGYFLLVLFSYAFTVMGIGGALSSGHIIGPRIAFASFVAGLLMCLLPVIILAFRARKPESEESAAGDNTPDECWRWGIVYYNPDDPALLLEKRVGFGWTLNYGNKWSWVCSVAILAIPVLLRLIWFM